MFLKALFSFLSFSVHSISGGIAPCCRFSPSCSQYASEAVERFGWFLGLRLAIGRVWRCRPGGASGWDPVPFHKVVASSAATKQSAGLLRSLGPRNDILEPHS